MAMPHVTEPCAGKLAEQALEFRYAQALYGSVKTAR